MALRTYYWNTRKTDLLRFVKHKIFDKEMMFFRYGNAGDIFNIDLIQYLYEEDPLSLQNEGNRLLLVGSIMNVLGEGDIVNGIGWKGNDMSHKQDLIEAATVYGVRGPLTKSLFEKYGSDLSQLKFEYDPGLLIKEVYNIDMERSKEKSILFIPHYRDLWVYKGQYPKGIKVLNIDNTPQKVAKEILKAKVVYASSLHGVIFGHALNKPVVLVKPQTEEPIFKYRDYYLSIGMEMPKPLENIHDVNYSKDIQTVLSKHVGLEDFYFPSKEDLLKVKIIT